MFYKRLLRLSLSLMLCGIFLLFACNKNASSKIPKLTGFSVTFLSVGQGDSAYITFPDGKNMMIDVGAKDKDNYENIKKVLEGSKKKDIDYLVLSHTGIDHVGNLLDLTKDYKIKTAFIPNVNREDLYPTYHESIETLKDSAEQIKFSNTNQYFSGEDYFVAFLSPYPKGVGGSFYNDLVYNKVPSESQENNISAVIYVEYKEFRFLFLGDAEEAAQKTVYNDYLAGLYDDIFGEYKVNLSNIDVLKVSHHGASDGVDDRLHSILMAKRCVISVGKGNYYGHPSTEAIEKLLGYNENAEIFRTDVFGNITFRYDNKKLITELWAD